MSHRFETSIELGGKTATGFEVPAAVVTALASGRKPRVAVSIGGHTYRSTVAVYGDRYMLPLNATSRSEAGVEAGDTVTVEVELDTAERVVDVPDDLAVALAETPGARPAFDSLSYSKQRERVVSVESAKREDTRKKRIAKIVGELSTSSQSVGDGPADR